jgi:hypothetical protein
VCFVSSTFFYPIAGRVIEPLEIGWVKFLIYAIVPASVTFIFLYRSRWHPEITGVARTCSLLLITCEILTIVPLTFIFVLGIAQVWIAVFFHGSGPG